MLWYDRVSLRHQLHYHSFKVFCVKMNMRTSLSCSIIITIPGFLIILKTKSVYRQIFFKPSIPAKNSLAALLLPGDTFLPAPHPPVCWECARTEQLADCNLSQ